MKHLKPYQIDPCLYWHHKGRHASAVQASCVPSEAKKAELRKKRKHG